MNGGQCTFKMYYDEIRWLMLYSTILNSLEKNISNITKEEHILSARDLQIFPKRNISRAAKSVASVQRFQLCLNSDRVSSFIKHVKPSLCCNLPTHVFDQSPFTRQFWFMIRLDYQDVQLLWFMIRLDCPVSLGPPWYISIIQVHCWLLLYNRGLTNAQQP